MHTLSFKDDLMVIDAKFHLIGVKSLLVRALRRMKRMNRSLSGVMQWASLRSPRV